MPLFTGVEELSLPDNSTSKIASTISTIILGTAPDGDIGEARYFNDPNSVSVAYGGMLVARLSPGPADSTFSLPEYFVPDSTTYSDLTPFTYDFSGENNAPQKYPYLRNLVFSQSSPIQLSFDPLGYSSSVIPASGGIFLEISSSFDNKARNSFASGLGVLSSDIRFPLISFLQEIGTDDFRVAGYRVGSSWLNSAPAFTQVLISGSAAHSVSGSITFSCLGIGDGTSSDRYLQTKVIVSPTYLAIDPGIDGLPARFMVYHYSNFSTWRDLFDQIDIDGYNGLVNLKITNRGLDSFQLTSPASTFSSNDPVVTFSVNYSDSVGTAPDLTTASGWVTLLTSEQPNLDSFGFICLSGLTCRALTQDPTSTAKLIDLLTITNNGYTNSDNLLVLPWDFVPGGTYRNGAISYDTNQDISDFQNLVSSIGQSRASKLLVFWGTFSQFSVPSIGNSSVQVPTAYAALSAIVRESLTSYSGTFGKPTLISALDSNVPNFFTTSPPSGITAQTGYPNPDTLSALQSVGLCPVTRSLSNRWSIHGPALQADKSPLVNRIAVLLLESLIDRYLSNYLGQPNNVNTRNNIKSDLNTISAGYTAFNYPIAGLVSSIDLELQVDPSLYLSTLSVIDIIGTIFLYSELSSVSFQTRITL